MGLNFKGFMVVIIKPFTFIKLWLYDSRL